jgi:hypothetical protein
MRIIGYIKKPALLTLFSALLFTGASQSCAQEADEHLKISLELASDTLTPGAASEIVLTIRPKKGFHVNAVPPVGFALDSGAVATLTDSLIAAQDTATGYLDVRSPVRQGFTLRASQRTGRYELAGTLTYYYCSDAEGWCRREKTPFSLPFTIR